MVSAKIFSLRTHKLVSKVNLKPGPTCTKHLNLRCSLSLTFPFVKIM